MAWFITIGIRLRRICCVRPTADPRVVGCRTKPDSLLAHRAASALVLSVYMAAALVGPAPAAAQTLRTLHVRDFSMGIDRPQVQVGELFHLTIHAAVAEEVTSLDEIGLPNLSAFEELGDERRCAATERGTECFETLTLDAAAPGDITIGPAVLDAVDGRTGHPSRFRTNPVRVRVVPVPFVNAVHDTLVQAAWLAARCAALGVLLVAAAFALAWVRGRARRGQPIPQAPTACVPPPAADEHLRQLVGMLAHEPTRSHAVAVRAALRERAGARDDETLSDLARRGATQGRVGAALAAVERASFCEDDRVAEAAREALPYLS